MQLQRILFVKHFLFRLLSGVAVASLSFTTHGIVNLEQAIVGKPTDGLHSRLELLASGSSGNTENSRIKFDLLTLWKHEKHTEFLQMQYAYGSSLGKVDTDNSFAHFRHRTEITDDWGIEGFAQISRNPFSRLSQRTILGGGARWILFEEDKQAAAYFGFGAFHEHETRSDLIGTTDQADIKLWRANSYLILKYQLNGQVRLVNNTYYQPALNDTSNYRLLEQASLLVKLDDNLDLKLSVEISFDSIPPETVHSKDVFYSTGLSLTF